MPAPATPTPIGVIPIDPTSGILGSVSPSGGFLTESLARQIFIDLFGAATLDTVNLWTTSNGGTGIAPSSPGTNGNTTLNGGTTANSYSALISKPQFQPSQPGYLINYHAINFPASIPINNYCAWGLMNIPGTPTYAAPVTDGAVFDVINGVLFAATWGAGVRLVVANLGKVQPTDAGVHKYWIRFRGDICFWSIDNEYNVVASYPTGASGPVNNTLSTGVLVVSNAGAAATVTQNAVTMADASAGAISLSDGVYPFRKASVNSKALNMAQAANYTAITTSGTTTVANGPGIYFSSYLWALGTGAGIGVLDGTNTLMAVSTSTTLLSALSPGPGGLGIKFNTSLVVVTSGTAAGSWNVLWD
ncbi:MAG TPA: hypothetical protein VN879_15815 [Candidatus Acidoferrales bacterium]|nr:hypothetical protein [Candidatus Acidoferrales bacterium]